MWNAKLGTLNANLRVLELPETIIPIQRAETGAMLTMWPAEARLPRVYVDRWKTFANGWLLYLL